MANCVICGEACYNVRAGSGGAEALEGQLPAWRQFHLGHFRGPLHCLLGAEAAVKHLVSEGNQNYYTLLTAPRKSPTTAQQAQKNSNAP